MYLGVDLGTSGVKAVLLDQQHHLHAQATAPLTQQSPRALRSEQHPHDWWQALESVMAQLRVEAPDALRRVRALGLSGQMHGAVVLNAAQQVLRPAILWNDGRAELQCAELERLVPASRQITGNLAMAGFTAPKLLWMRAHEPDIFKLCRRVLLPKDWLRLELTGDAVSDMSDASGTLWLDVQQRQWSPEMLAACGLDERHMPGLVEGSAVSGVLRPTLAARWGLPANVMVAGGGGDNAASAVGIGATQAGQGFVSLGTSGVVFEVGATYQAAPERAVHAFAHALPGRWHQMSVMLSAASAFGWVTRLTASASEAALAQHVAELSPDLRERAPIFLPYLSGERTPHNNPQAAAAFAGLRAGHLAPDLGYAVMEGVAFGLRDGLCAMGSQASRPLALVGGGARSDAWAQLLATVLNRPLHRFPESHSAAAIGAARMAWLACAGDEATVCPSPADAQCFEPRAQDRDWLMARYARFQALYSAAQG